MLCCVNRIEVIVATAFGLEFGSAARLSERPGSVWNCLLGHAL